MMLEPLFSVLDSAAIALFIHTAQHSVCYAGPGIQLQPAKAIVEVAQRLGPEMMTVCIDCDERVMRMGYGDIEALECLRDGPIVVRNASGLRTALVIVDDQGFIFTPTALYIEAEPHGEAAPNAMRLSQQQVAEALARLSPAAKAIAQTQATTHEEQNRIAALPVEVATAPITEAQFAKVEASLKEAPPVKFDVARQVRVFEPYLQYIELSLTGAAIQRYRLAVPPNIQKLGSSSELEGRLRTTFDLIEKGGKLSSKALEDELNEIRKNFTPSLGKDHGRVMLKAAKPHLEKRLGEFRKKLEAHQKTVEKELQKHLDESRKQVVNYYEPIVMRNPSDALLGQLLHNHLSEDDVPRWLDTMLKQKFPPAEKLIQKMQLVVRYKDVTFETLNHPDFLESVKNAFPDVDWDKAYEEFKAAGEVAAKNENLD
jgi:hypothetical protein